MRLVVDEPPTLLFVDPDLVDSPLKFYSPLERRNRDSHLELGLDDFVPVPGPERPVPVVDHADVADQVAVVFLLLPEELPVLLLVVGEDRRRL